MAFPEKRTASTPKNCVYGKCKIKTKLFICNYKQKQNYLVMYGNVILSSIMRLGT
jgi:hypothetical protein